jgi:aldose 1-epimerase
VLEVDPERMLPTGRSLPTAGTELDFAEPRPIGSTVLDRCFAQLARDAEGRAQVSLRHPATGRTVRVWMDASFRYVQLYSGETLAPERRRRGLAIEPMTCPPNAFRTGTDLVVLEPEASRSFRWGVTVSGGI